MTDSVSVHRPGLTEIPTAALMTGVNMPDHDNVFSLLVDKLRHVTRHISLLPAGLTIKQMVSKLVLDFVNQEGEKKTRKNRNVAKVQYF